MGSEFERPTPTLAYRSRGLRRWELTPWLSLWASARLFGEPVDCYLTIETANTMVFSSLTRYGARELLRPKIDA